MAVVVRLDCTRLKIDPLTTTKNGDWHTYASFNLSEKKRKWGLLGRKVTYNLEDLMLLIGPKSLTVEDVDGASEEDKKKQLVMDNFEPESIEAYIDEKVQKAAKEPTIEKAFEFLEKYFLVDNT